MTTNTDQKNVHTVSITNAQQKLIDELIATASCGFKPDYKHCCGRKHGQKEGGNTISLFEARIGLEVKGVICNKCIPLIPIDLGKYSFVPIAVVASMTVTNTRLDMVKPGGGNDGGGAKTQKRRSKRNERHNERAPQAVPALEQKLEAKEQSKAAPIETSEELTAPNYESVEFGRGLLYLVTEGGLPLAEFNLLVDQARTNEKPLFELIKRTRHGQSAIDRVRSKRRIAAEDAILNQQHAQA